MWGGVGVEGKLFVSCLSVYTHKHARKLTTPQHTHPNTQTHRTTLSDLESKETAAAQRIARLRATLSRLGVPAPPPAEKKTKGEKDGEEEVEVEVEEEMEVDPAMAALPVDVRQRCVRCVISWLVGWSDAHY